MNIILLGTGVAIPQLEKAQSGILVKTPEELILFDCGAGILAASCRAATITARYARFFSPTTT